MTIRAVSRGGLLALACGIVALAGYLGGIALGTTTDCYVNASVGFKNCLSYSNPSSEGVQAREASGVGYKTQFWRPSDGATWGPWNISNQSPQTFSFNLAGSITLQVNNLGTGQPSRYTVAMS